jgi:hypothetical protein
MKKILIILSLLLAGVAEAQTYKGKSLQLRGALAQRPSCTAATQGGVFNSIYTSTTAADLWHICSKNAAGAYAWKPLFSGNGGDMVYGNGTDGTTGGCDAPGVTRTLTRDIICSNFGVNVGDTVYTAGFVIYATGTAAIYGTISNDGAPGVVMAAGGGALSNAAGATSSTTRWGGSSGGAGVATGNGVAGVNVTGCFGSAVGGTGGNATIATGAAGGTIITPIGTLFHFPVSVTTMLGNAADLNMMLCGGTGGGSGGYDNPDGVGSGAGGGGGGIVHIIARRVLVQSTGVVTANGGAGGDSGGAGVGGGGGGGAGGRVIITASIYENLGTVTATGGAGGAGSNGGSVGAAGANGTVLIFYHTAN